jgi:FMN phosphatase YigB (HAD superfamily)
VDAYGFSFALGSMKPEAFFYRATCELMGASSCEIDNGQVLMIGDSKKCDRDGPQAIGIRGFLLSRDSGEGFNTLDEFSDMVLKTH